MDLLESYVRKECRGQSSGTSWKESSLNFGNRTATKNVPLAWPPEASPTCAACSKCPGPSSDVATEKTGQGGSSQRAESGPSQGGGPHGTCHRTCCLLPALLQLRASPALSLSLSHHLILVQSGQ